MDALFATGLPPRSTRRAGRSAARVSPPPGVRGGGRATTTTTRTNAQTDAVELVIEAPRGALPREAMRRVLDAAPVDALGDFQKRYAADGDAGKSAAEKAGETTGRADRNRAYRSVCDVRGTGSARRATVTTRTTKTTETTP